MAKAHMKIKHIGVNGTTKVPYIVYDAATDFELQVADQTMDLLIAKSNQQLVTDIKQKLIQTITDFGYPQGATMAIGDVTLWNSPV